MEKKYVTVFSRNMCNALLKRGFNVIEVKQDNVYPERTVFFFHNGKAIAEAIKEIAEQKKH